MCLMKNLIKSISLLAVAAMGLSACNEQNLTPEQVGKGEFVTVHFGANSSIEPATKATLTTEDEKTFKSAWEKGENISLYYINGNIEDGTITPSWDSDKSLFPAQLPEYKGEWEYQACYPVPGQDYAVDFGKDRTQKENAYNSAYDIMTTQKITIKNGDQGKDDNGNDVVLPFDRQTGIVYFHFTTTAFDEPLVKATLTIEGGNIASTKASIEDFVFLANEDIDNITITFPESASSSSDFKLWFNVLPTSYTSMSLHVETTGHTLDITNANAGSFVAGKLYKTVATVPDAKWVAKAVSVEKWVKVTDASTLAAGDELIMVSDTLAAGDIEGENVYLSDVKIVVNEDESVTIGSDVLVFTLGGVEGGWTLSNNDGKMLGATDLKKLAWGSGTTTWLISIDETGDATIQNTHKNSSNSYDYGRFLYNVKYTRFTTYTSNTDKGMLLPSLYRLEGSTPKTALDTPANLSVSAAKVVSWDAVSGAASYNVTIGSETYTSETNSYDASAIEDEYYDVSVVAVPSDKENYKNSAAATLTAVKFGTPTLATPVLKEGLVDDASVNVTWTADSRAINGYKCEIYNGETLVESKDVTDNAVEFTELTAETSYTIKVQAKAVEGTKAYAASEIATLSVTTKAAGVQANDGTKEHPYTAAEAITVIDAGADLENKYVKGVITKVTSFNSQYGSLVYDIESGDATLNIYGGLDLGNTKFYGTDDLKVGEEVIVFGTLKKYNSIYEMDKNNYLISVDGKTEIYRGLEISGQKTSFTVGDAFEFGGKVLQVWRGKDAVDVTTTATFSGYDMSTEGTQTVTITVGEETLTYNIDVRAAGAVEEEKVAQINFNSNAVKISSTSVTGNDSQNNSWTITTVGTTSFTSNKSYYQVGASKKPATSITFTTTLPGDAEVTAIEAKFGGFSDTAGNVDLKVGETSIGKGVLNGTKDVIITSTSTTEGNVVTISVTNISKGVKCYYIKLNYKTAN